MATRDSSPSPIDRSPNAIDPLDSRQGQLLAIARRIFAQRGFNGTSLRDIAEEAKITKAALYYYFPNKEALYEQVVIESMQSLLDLVSAQVERAGSPTARVRAYLSASADFMDHKRDQWMAGSNAFRDGSQLASRGVALHQRDAYEKLLRRCIVDGIAAGEFRAVDPAIAGRLLLSALNHLPRWHSPGGSLSARQVMDQYIDIILVGIASPSMQARPDATTTTARTIAAAKAPATAAPTRTRVTRTTDAKARKPLA